MAKDLRLRITPLNPIGYKAAVILELPKACKQKEYWLSPFEFTNLLFKAFKLFTPDLYILDLRTDIIFKKSR